MDDLVERHYIRPWRPPLSLVVREITSVSVTFVLSSLFSVPSAPHSESLDSLGLSDDEEQESASESDCDGDSSRQQIVSDILSKGLSVKVNGIPWQRVLIRVDDEADEAFIILFGLMPGRQYDVELGVVPGERSLRGQITTNAEAQVDASQDVHHDDAMLSTSVPSSTASQALSASPSTSSSLTPSSSQPTLLTLEDKRVQLTHMLSALNAEHAQLSAALKAARRESQKADAGVRAEIEALRRAAEKGAANEQRTRQKLLALREARRQTETAAEAMEAARKEVEAALPELEERVREVQDELEYVKVKAIEMKREREEVEGRERRRREGWNGELGALTRTLEKLNVRREKLEGNGTESGGGTIGQLEDKLRGLEEERSRIERDPYSYEGETGSIKTNTDGGREDGDESIFNIDSRTPGRQEHHATHSSSSHSSHSQHHQHHSHTHSVHSPQHSLHAHHSQSRKRHSQPHQHPNNHPYPPHNPSMASQHRAPLVPMPIQRPSHSGRPSLPNHRELVAGPGIIHLHPSAHKPPSQGRVPQPQYSQHSHRSHTGSTSGSGGSSPALPASASGSSLSGRAPPFEPSGIAIRSTGKSELNPGSNPFSPRSAAAQAAGARLR